MESQILARVLSSNFPTILSVSFCLVLIAYFWYVHIPKMEDKETQITAMQEELETLRNEEKTAAPVLDQAVLDMLKGIDEALAKLESAETTPQESNKMWLNMSKHLERNIGLLRHEGGMTSENINEILSEIAIMRTEVSEFRRHQQIILQRLKELTAAFYSSSSPRNPEGLNDLRELG